MEGPQATIGMLEILTLFPGAIKFSSEGFSPKKLLLPGFPKSAGYSVEWTDA